MRHLDLPRVLLSANRWELGGREWVKPNRASLKAGQFSSTKTVFWGVTWRDLGTGPIKNSRFWPAFRLLKYFDLAGRGIPCHLTTVTHNALQDISDIYEAAVSRELSKQSRACRVYSSWGITPWVALSKSCRTNRANNHKHFNMATLEKFFGKIYLDAAKSWSFKFWMFFRVENSRRTYFFW